MNDVLAMRMRRLEQSGGEASRRSEAGARRDIGHAGDFQVRLFDPRQPQCFANDRMLHLVRRLHVLHLGILDDQTRRKV